MPPPTFEADTKDLRKHGQPNGRLVDSTTILDYLHLWHAKRIVLVTSTKILTVVAQVHCPQSQAQESQTKVESSLSRGKQATRVNTFDARVHQNRCCHGKISTKEIMPAKII